MLDSQTVMAPRLAGRDAELTLGLQHHKAGEFDRASDIYRSLYLADRRDSEVIFLMGVLCCDLGAFEPACQFLDEALAIAPNFREARGQWIVAMNAWADAKISAGHAIEAKRLLVRVAARAPGDAATLRNLGRVALMQGQTAEAEAKFTASLTLGGDHVEALNWRGLAQLQAGKFDAAETSLRQALKLKPDLIQAHNNLGLALQRQGKLSDAQQSFQAALTLDPSYQKARINLASTRRILGDYTLAQHELEMVLAQQPDAAEALNNLGALYQDQGRAQLALRTLTRARDLAPDVAEIRWNLALTQLAVGDFKNGWSNFESRWAGCDSLRGGYRFPENRAWKDEPLGGKRLLLWSEQGFGDSLQFIRFAKDVAARGATVLVVAQAELAELLQSAPGVTTVVVQGTPLPAYDYHCPLMSLPLRLGKSLQAADLHGAAPYLRAAQSRIDSWQPRVQSQQGLKVGLVWAGSSRSYSPELAAIDARRSMPVQRLAPLLAVRGCSFFSLQKNPVGAGNGALPQTIVPAIHDFSAEWKDFSDTAALIATLDLVISVDTAVAHLAGALGKPVWLLNRYDSCWRWMLERSDSPWYSTLRQFRQPSAGDWASVIDLVASALAELAMAPKALSA